MEEILEKNEITVEIQLLNQNTKFKHIIKYILQSVT